jgi:hypothetical protein
MPVTTGTNSGRKAVAAVAMNMRPKVSHRRTRTPAVVARLPQLDNAAAERELDKMRSQGAVACDVDGCWSLTP